MAEKAGHTLIELAVAFVINHPGVTSGIIGPHTMEQLEAFLPTADITLSADVFDAVEPDRTAYNYRRRQRTCLQKSGWPTHRRDATSVLRRRGIRPESLLPPTLVWGTPQFRIACCTNNGHARAFLESWISGRGSTRCGGQPAGPLLW
ncbi:MULTISPECIES: aldo/keto reductase [Streptomyces]|uniref:aldo/keto reductase n=1 Tax=Streptomyces TaxID=1883 RepID=UPI001EF1D61E|nr:MULTISPECIES: aldo/keto reductase [unclassified Streptomyces]